MSTLIQIVTAALASATLRSGAHLVCRPGCTQCCIGVFPIAQQDAARLREGLASLTQTDPARAARIGTRVASIPRPSRPMASPATPQPASSPKTTTDRPAFEEFANDEPCPVLDPATGTCDLYSHRPILCRTFGPPMRTPDGNLAHCELCYTTATTDEIAACELDPTLPETILASDEAFDAAHRLHGDAVPSERSSSSGQQTLVAYALR